MKRLISVVAIGVVCAWATWGGDATAKVQPDLVVHEWGTFTSMQGQSGKVLEGLHHEEEALPAFVHTLNESRAEVSSIQGKGLPAVTRVTQKMETPVIYFYSKTPTKVDVSVTFQKGIISQWYPAANHDATIQRCRSHEETCTVDMRNVDQSTIDWKLDLIPRQQNAPAGIPSVDASAPWAFARDVAASYVKNRVGEAEHYLFYRGLGRYRLPIQVNSDKGGRTSVINDSKFRLPDAFLLEYGPGGARWLRVGPVKGKGAVDRNLSQLPLRDGEVVVSELRAHVQKALVKSGLYADEARAMVRTWSRAWFASEGTRLIYLLPRELTDELLPIKISPSPKSLVRTLVGRLEYITHATGAEVAAAVRDRYSPNKKLSAAASARLGRLGRFLEPHLRNVLAVNSDKHIQRIANRMLEQIRRRGE